MTGSVVILVVAAAAIALFVPLRIAVAKQRRAMETVRARLAAAKVHRRAEGVPVEAIQMVGDSVGHVSRSATCALADDGFYALSADGRWGGRVRYAPGPLEIGDEALVAAPCLVKAGAAVAPGVLPEWVARLRTPLPPDGLLLRLDGGLSWFVAVSDPDGWFAALTPLLPRTAGATT